MTSRAEAVSRPTSDSMENKYGQLQILRKSSGIFKNKHPECDEKHSRALSGVETFLDEALQDKVFADTAQERLKEIAGQGFLDQNEIRQALIHGWELRALHFLDDNLLEESEETKLMNLFNSFSLTQNELDQNGIYSKVAKAALLRDIMNGRLPGRVEIDGQLPVNIQKTEKPIWVFHGVGYFEDKTRTHFVGASQGVSMRIAKGLYYRVGSFKGSPVSTTERVQVDAGSLVITNKTVYFTGKSKAVKIPFTKIISFFPYSDGVGLMRDARMLSNKYLPQVMDGSVIIFL